MPSRSRRKRTLAIVSSSRADLAHLVHPLRALAGSDVLEPVVLATGAMLQRTFGNPVELLGRELHAARPGPLPPTQTHLAQIRPNNKDATYTVSPC